MALTPEQAESRVILKILAGSHVHGLNIDPMPCEACKNSPIAGQVWIKEHIDDGMGTQQDCPNCGGTGYSHPGSDRDEEAIVVEPLSEAWSLGKPWEDTVIETPAIDVKYFSLRKWCRMAAKGNPNFLLMLFASPTHVLKYNALGSQLRDMRGLFISKQAIRSHLGYMQGQRQRLLNHNHEFGAGHGRGLPRYDLVEQYGFDVKFAMHLLRLGYQGLELAKTGKLTLPIAEDDRQLLLKVRRGEYDLPWVLKWAEDLEAAMKAAFDSSSLPDEPNYAEIEAWLQKVYIRTWSAERRLQDVLEHSMLFQGHVTH